MDVWLAIGDFFNQNEYLFLNAKFLLKNVMTPCHSSLHSTFRAVNLHSYFLSLIVELCLQLWVRKLQWVPAGGSRGCWISRLGTSFTS